MLKKRPFQSKDRSTHAAPLLKNENHHSSGAILHSSCIFNRKLEKKWPFNVQLAVDSIARGDL